MNRANFRFRSAFAGLLILGAIAIQGSSAQAACADYEEARQLNRSQFLALDHVGALGVPTRNGHEYFLFDKPGCYDGTRFRRNTLSFFLNNKASPSEPAYLAALTIATRDYELGGAVVGRLNLRRNREDPSSPDRWVRFVDDPAADVVGTSPNGGEVFKVGGYEKAEAYTFSRLAEIAPLLGDRNQEASKLWHAFVGDREPRSHYPVRILADSMGSVPFIAPTPEAAIDAAKSVAATAHLVKFRWSEVPSLKDPLLDINISRARCLYLKYHLSSSPDGATDGGDGDYIRIRLQEDATC